MDRAYEPRTRPEMLRAVEIRAKLGRRVQNMDILFTGWTDTELVLDQLGNPILADEDLRYLNLCVDAANRAVAYWRPDLIPPVVLRNPGPFSLEMEQPFMGGGEGVLGADPMIRLGATMLATRYFQRKGGIDTASFTEFGGPVPAIDKDVEQMLRINRAAIPRIA